MLWKRTLFFLLAASVRLWTGAQVGAAVSVLRPPFDSAVAYASLRYQPNSFLRRIFMGDNYREAWRHPVKLPVFRLSQSGLTVHDLGGGAQTKSLHLRDAQGKYWGLRTVDKIITDAGISPGLRNFVGRKLSEDIISSAFPYAGPLAGELAYAAGITAARPTLFVVADDEAIRPYRQFFAGKICMLEERDPGFDSTDNSTELYNHLRRDSRYRVQPTVYLKARLLDVLTADWDRHSGNWRWGLKDSAGFHFYYAVPRDRDWAFYDSRGWIPWLSKVTGAMRYLTGFKKHLSNVKNLSWKSWTMDKVFLGELDAVQWEDIVREFTNSLSDEAIEAAVKILPPEVYATGGAAFVQKLKNRRDGLMKEAMKYYRFLSQEVIINGSDAKEKFVISSAGDTLNVAVYLDEGEKKKVYERRFSSKETFRITINALGGDDIFIVREKVRSSIRVDLNGDAGQDLYFIKGKLRIRSTDKQERFVSFL